jgi:hypothetical protein
LDRLGDTFTRKGFLSETSLDIIQDFGMGGVIFVQNIFERQIRGTKAVAEVLSKDPTAVYTFTFLVIIVGKEMKEPLHA